MLRAMMYTMLSQRKLIFTGTVAALFGISLNYNTIWQYTTTGHIAVHWIYIVTGAFFVLFGLQSLALGILRRILALLRESGKQNYVDNYSERHK